MRFANIVVLPLAGALLCATADATPIFDVQFTGDTPGNSPNVASATAGGTSTLPTSVTSPVTGVSVLNGYTDSLTSAAFGTGNVLAFNPSSGYTQVTGFQGALADAQSTGIFTISFDMMEDKGSAATGFVRIGATDQPGGKVLSGYTIILGSDADNIRVDTSIDSSTILGTLSRGVAHHFDWVIDMDAPNATAASLYLDGNLLGTLPRDPVGVPHDGASSFGRFKVSRDGAGDGTIVFDNFKIQSGNAVPEPTSAALLVAAAGWLAVRRR